MDDMTPDEAVLMRAHREYWTPRVETGVVVAMGPVADPAGGHGVAIIEAASTAAAKRWSKELQWRLFSCSDSVLLASQRTSLSQFAT